MVGGSGRIGRIPAATVLAVVVAGCAVPASPLGALPPLGPAAAADAPPPSTPAAASSVRAQLTGTVERYFRVTDQLGVRMDAHGLSRLFTPGCPCQQQARAVRAAAARGERYVERIRINALRPNLDGPTSADVLADYNLIRAERVDAAGHPLGRTRPHRVWWDFRLVRRGHRWLIARIDAIS